MSHWRQRAASRGAGTGALRMATGAKRYNLVLPQALFDEVQRMAAAQHSTIVEVLRQFIRVLLVA